MVFSLFYAEKHISRGRRSYVRGKSVGYIRNAHARNKRRSAFSSFRCEVRKSLYLAFTVRRFGLLLSTQIRFSV